MNRRHEQAIIFSLHLVFIMLIAPQTVSAETCDELQCLNSNACQSYITEDNSTHARCICSGKWAGPRCEHLIRLEPRSVTSSQAILKVSLMTSQYYDVPDGSSAMSLVDVKEERGMKFNYTLIFWRRNDTITSLTSDSSLLTSGEISCVLLHKTSSAQPTVEGLQPRTRYTICVENGFVDSCVLSSFTDSSSVPFPPSSHVTSLNSGVTSSWPANCVTIFTPHQSLSVSDNTRKATVTLVAVVSVLILVILIIVFIVFLLYRQSLAVRLFVGGVCCGWCCCKCQCCGSERSCNNDEHFPVETARLNGSSAHTGRTVFIENDSPGERTPRRKTVLQRLRPCSNKKRQQKSSSYTSANMLLPPPTQPPSPPTTTTTSEFQIHETLPLDPNLSDDCVFENSPPKTEVTATALPAIHRGRGKPRHRLSRKRRGYVAYSTKKDKNIRLTTVLENPLDDEDEDVDEDNYDEEDCVFESLAETRTHSSDDNVNVNTL